MITSDQAAAAFTTRFDGVPPLRLQPARALRALARLRENPNETAEVFTIIESLSGQAPRRVLKRFQRDPAGQLLLSERPSMLSTLLDRARLGRMPRDSLAQAYLSFTEREGITADGLVSASYEGRTGELEPHSDFAYVTERLRDTHDLWHTVTGYQGDLVGEAGLLAFMVAQLGNPGMAAIVLTALVQFRDAQYSELIGRAFLAGLRAAWLPPVHWEVLLPLPLAQVRSILRIAQAPAYAPLRISQSAAATSAHDQQSARDAHA